MVANVGFEFDRSSNPILCQITDDVFGQVVI